jgi:hypothetical protein
VRLFGIERGAAQSDRPQRAIHGSPVQLGFYPMLGRPRERRFDLDRCFLDPIA